ncbi:MAG: pyridoxamine 5'-phosphate oxidase family protein [Coriobacteriales bacterium]|jgi:uncharacterized pyridoxamine 5'-phosphate oxidase family protein|nr:pyridoxamine 5'-phosphate oxidase family protein [Coriobacteriales bacterium]
MEEVYEFLKKAQTYYLATVEGDQPRVRPLGTIDLFEGKLYIQTALSKAVSRQIAANPKVEICAFVEGEWLRVETTLVDDPRSETQAHMLDAYPMLKDRYAVDDGNNQVLYLQDATASFFSFTSPEPHVVEF